MASGIRVVLAGARGRVGSVLVPALKAEAGIDLTAALGRGDDLADALVGADVLVDFTAPVAAPGNAMLATGKGVAPIVGTSGLDPALVDELERSCAGRGGAVIPNFALGAVLMMRLAELAAPHL